jgi:hypothetical protein
MNRLEELRRTLDNQAAGFPTDVDPWELARELLDEVDAMREQLRLVPGDMWGIFAETAAENARLDAEETEPTP